MRVSLKAVSGSTSTVALCCAFALWSVALCFAQNAPSPSSEAPPAASQIRQATEPPAPAIRQTPPDSNPAPPPAAASQPATSALPQLPPARKSGTEAKPAADTKTSYVIGPLDVLVIKVWGQANLSGPVDVTPDGTISLPLIGDVKADGLTKEQLKEAVATKLGDFLNSPEVDVQVARINSKRFFVYGGVGHQGEFPLVRPTTVMDAMSSVGGFRDFSNTKKIRIQRVLPDGTIQEFKFNYRDVSKGKNMEQNILLQNGDRIFVPE